MACCLTCGQTLPADSPAETILRGKRLELFRRIKRAGQHGISSPDLFDYLYSDDPEGGPNTGVKVITVHICHINKQIRQFGIAIKNDYGGHGVYSEYKIVNVAG